MREDIELFAKRVINILRPKPRLVPLTVDEILDNSTSMQLVDRFNDLYYKSGVFGSLSWRGLPLLKNPCDLWTFVELIVELRPAVILETGTHHGGSALFFADMAAVLGIDCRVVTIDINPKWTIDPGAHRIVSLSGRSTDPSVAARASVEVAAIRHGHDGAVIVTLDSDHSEANVLLELETYGPLVTPGSYLVVEDTNVNGHPTAADHGPGPWEAVSRFLQRSDEFEVDRSRERHLMTFNPGGWLRRRAPGTR